MKKMVVVFGLLLMVLSMSSCNTYIGLGRDIQKLGEGIQNSGYNQGSTNSPTNSPNPYGVPEAQEVKKR